MEQSGKAFLLKFADDKGDYNTVAGLRTTLLSINGDVVAQTRREGWRELVCEAGTRSVSIAAKGIFLGSAAESETRAHALTGSLPECELSFEDGERLRGKFLIQRLDYAGDFNGERQYALQLESSGPVVPVPARGMEARQGGNAAGGAVHDSPSREGAPTPAHPTPGE